MLLKSFLIIDLGSLNSLVTTVPLVFRGNYALAVTANRFVILSGGYDRRTRGASAEVLGYDTKENKWVESPTLPCMNEARQSHCSCATERSVFVFGGN